MKLRVRDGEARFVDDPVAIEDEIEIERAGRAPRRPRAAACSLEIQEQIQQRPRREGRVPHHRRVQVAGLRALDIDRRGLVKGRGAKVGEMRRELANRPVEVGPPVAQIAAERDRDWHLRGDRYWIHLTGSTPPPVVSPPVRRPRRSSRPAPI